MFCIWLRFNSAYLSEIILKLARKYNGPVFQPHCTLIGKTDVSLPRLKSAIIDLDRTFDLRHVRTKNISFSDNYWRSFYIELDEKMILTKWHEHICDILSIKHDRDFLPHISLMYNSISREEKERVSKNMQLKSTNKIHSIQIIDCNDKVDEWRAVFELNI